MRSRFMMMVQRLKLDYFKGWTSKKYGDDEIIKNADAFLDSKGPSPVAKAYRDYYVPLVKRTKHSFNDYDYLFGSSTPRVAGMVLYHIFMRVIYFYYRDASRNEKHKRSKGKGSKSRRLGFPLMNGILHDKDKKKISSDTDDVAFEPVSPHIHLNLKFTKQVSLNQISRWVGTPPNYFETGSRGRYAFENAEAYLIHAKQPDKHTYDPSDVVSTTNFDFMTYYHKHADRWRNYNAKRETQTNHASADWLVKQVQHGKLNKTDILNDKRLKYIYADNMDRINNAILFRQEDLGNQTLNALKKGEFRLTVLYIYGEAGSGKTKLAQSICNQLYKQHKWRTYKAASSNSMDDYVGQPIVLMDDVRSSTMEPSDWLHLLDPGAVNPATARYHNKNNVAPRVIIMTNTQPPATFFGFMANVHGNEPLGQFMRRLDLITKVICTDTGQRIYENYVIRKLNKSAHIKIGESEQGDIDKSTRYVPFPYKFSDNAKEALKFSNHVSKFNRRNLVSAVTSFIDKRNDKSKKHDDNVGKKPKVSNKSYSNAMSLISASHVSKSQRADQSMSTSYSQAYGSTYNSEYYSVYNRYPTAGNDLDAYVNSLTKSDIGKTSQSVSQSVESSSHTIYNHDPFGDDDNLPF